MNGERAAFLGSFSEPSIVVACVRSLVWSVPDNSRPSLLSYDRKRDEAPIVERSETLLSSTGGNTVTRITTVTTAVTTVEHVEEEGRIGRGSTKGGWGFRFYIHDHI